MQCLVYKSLKQFDYYLFVKKDEDVTRVPDALKILLGKLEVVTEVDLHDRRKLAQADVIEVMAQIEVEGYYLQMPPRQGLEPDAS